MAYTFTVDKPRNLLSVIRYLKQLAADNNINCQGDEKSGCGESHGIKAKYEVGASGINITIEKKPIVIPNALIKKQVGDFLTELDCQLD